MLLFLLACTAASGDSSATDSSTDSPPAEALPSPFATMDPSCDEVDGGAWQLTIGQASATCPGASWRDLGDVIRLNISGSQAGPDVGGETIDLVDTTRYSAVNWRRDGEEGTVTRGILTTDAWDPATATLTGSIDLEGAFTAGPVRAAGAFSVVYCPDPELLCG